MGIQKFGIGQAVRRKEDDRFLTGRGNYIDDINKPDQAYLLILRSPHAHARILSVDTDMAKDMEGVLAIITGQDFEEAGYGHLSCAMPMTRRDGSPLATSHEWLLARDTVRYVGQPVAGVIAETKAQAQEALDSIFVDYDILEAITTPEAAKAADAPQLWETAPGNESAYWEKGDKDATDRAFAEADHTIKVQLNQNRITSATMEPRGAVASYDDTQDRYELYVSCQGAHNMQQGIARELMKIDPAKLHVISPDVGGGFGMKAAAFPEYVVALHGARQIGRPVKWIADRSESFLSDSHSRYSSTTGELAFDNDGTIRGLRVYTTATVGAYNTGYGPLQFTFAEGRWIASAYKIPAAHLVSEMYFTNTAPMNAYRGAGRPEAAYVTERLVDVAARTLGMDQAAFRRRNFVTPDMMPHKAWNGLDVHSSDFDQVLTKALEMSDWDGFTARKQDSEARGLRRGIGLAYYFETAAAGVEGARVAFTADGKAKVYVGTQSNGQGHETVFAQVVVDQLGLDFDDIEIVQGDTDLLARGNGTGGSRSAQMASGSIRVVGETVIEKGRGVAAEILQSVPEKVAFETQDEVGTFVVADSGASVTLKDVIQHAATPQGNALDSDGVYKAQGGSEPNGCHICEVEIDPETGKVAIARYTVVDDFGTVLNPAIVDGQVLGGLAQGIGQVLLEECVYDPDSGQLLTGSFSDYAMPRADDLVMTELGYCEIKDESNPLGVKGCGEAGTTGALPATVNAIVDALSDLGVQELEMPATPQKIWALMQKAR
ncbi:MAG: xanthine dehydrogenase family protein molybdopterin-binding subunit [Alphaproteobacteria bacterium]|nr:MAG: xanthine dehydrogenase family protein molybdopterin-binding subunit [Alphaproteobacteria bacterium]